MKTVHERQEEQRQAKFALMEQQIKAGTLVVRKMTAATNVLTAAGSFTEQGYTNGAGASARFSGADGVCVSQGTIYVADSSNQRIRSITFNP